MPEYTRVTQPDEKPSRLQLAIRDWQRQLVEKAAIVRQLSCSEGAE
jgi:hypothetical protein